MRELILSHRFSEEEKARLTSRLMVLLAKQAQRYTAGESTSIAAETAQELLESLQYTLMAAIDETDGDYGRLLNDELPELTERGREILGQIFEHTKRLWEAVCRTAPDTENLYYTDTLRGIGDYFRNYDLIFFAHMKPPCIDYPLLLPVDESLAGMSYTREYLRRLLAENLLLSHFDADTLQSLPSAQGMNKKEAYLNLCEQPLTNAVGLSLIKKKAGKLHTGSAEREEIIRLLAFKTHGEREKLLRASAIDVCDFLRITDRFVTEYVTSFALNLLPRLETALEFGDVSNIFIE